MFADFRAWYFLGANAIEEKKSTYLLDMEKVINNLETRPDYVPRSEEDIENEELLKKASREANTREMSKKEIILRIPLWNWTRG